MKMKHYPEWALKDLLLRAILLMLDSVILLKKQKDGIVLDFWDRSFETWEYGGVKTLALTFKNYSNKIYSLNKYHSGIIY